MIEIEYFFMWDGSIVMDFYDDNIYIGWCHSTEDFKIHWFKDEEDENRGKIKKYLKDINIVWK